MDDSVPERDNPPESTPYPRASTGNRQANVNLVIAIALAIISLCALVVSIYQTRILVDQQRLATKAEKAQLWPRIEANFGGFYSGNSYREVYFTIENVGTGPAIIESFELRYQGKVCTSWQQLYLLLRGDQEGDLMDGISMVNQNPAKDVLKVGEELTLFRLVPSKPDSILTVMKAFESPESISYSLCYRSVFDDYWSINGPLIENLVAEEGCNTKQ